MGLVSFSTIILFRRLKTVPRKAVGHMSYTPMDMSNYIKTSDTEVDGESLMAIWVNGDAVTIDV